MTIDELATVIDQLLTDTTAARKQVYELLGALLVINYQLLRVRDYVRDTKAAQG